MQRSGSKSTIPSSRLYSAVTGQISTHGASVQWLQVTAQNREMPPRVRELTPLDVLHPRPKHPQLHPVLDLARDRARVAADAPRLVKHERILTHPHRLSRRPP